MQVINLPWKFQQFVYQHVLLYSQQIKLGTSVTYYILAQDQIANIMDDFNSLKLN